MPGAKKKPDPNKNIYLFFLEMLIEMIMDGILYPTPHLSPAEPGEFLESQADVKICSVFRGFCSGSALGKPVYSTAWQLEVLSQNYLSSNKAQ